MQVNEIFYSVQGEGQHVGTPMIFVRFSGCNLKCSWCDTLHEMGVYYAPSRLIDRIMKMFEKTKCKNICLTGGEPTIQPYLKEFIIQLLSKGFDVFVETNGTGMEYLPKYVPAKEGGGLLWITYSPKRETQFKLGVTINTPIINEVKIIVDNQITIKEIERICQQVRNLEFANTIEVKVYLQPQWGNKEALEKTLRWVKANYGCKLSLQMQKYINVR